MTVQDTWSLPGILGGGVKTNDRYTDGNLFLTFPAYSSIGRDGWLDGDVIFIEPYSSWGEQGEVAVSLGLGWRHLFSRQTAEAVTRHDGHQAGFWEEGGFIGANLFVDMLDTQFDNRFWQLGFGLEAGTRYLEARANYYLPLSDRQLAEEIRTQQSFTTHSSVTGYEEPFGTGHTIQQDVTLTTFATTTTIERLFRRYEEGMEGWDAELALLLPWIDRWMDVKLIGGYYAFDNQPFGPQTGGTGNVEGWKAGLEVRPVPAVVLNATWYEDDRLTGSDWTAGVRLEVPFEVGDLGDGKGFWDRIGDAFRPRRRHLAERMVEPVRRQNAAIKTSTSVEEDRAAAEMHVVTKVVSQSTRRIVLANTVVFVDNAIGSPTNPGTYEAPLDTIVNGMNFGTASYGNAAVVMVQGRSAAYPESVVITEGVRLFGSGSFPGLGGQFFHGRTRSMPTVSGGFFAQNISDSVQITGFSIRDGLVGTPFIAPGILAIGSGIFFHNVSNGIITKNSIQVPSANAGVYSYTSLGTSRLDVSENVITGGAVGVGLNAVNAAFAIANIRNNLIVGSQSHGFYTTLEDNAIASIMLTGNTIINSTGNGVIVLATGNSKGSITVADNVIAGHTHWGMNLISFDSAGANYAITSNLIQGNGDGGISAVATSGTRIDMFLSDNRVIFNQVDQILASDIVIFHPGALSNDVLEAPANSGNLYNSAGTPFGFIFINGFLHPANVDLP